MNDNEQGTTTTYVGSAAIGTIYSHRDGVIVEVEILVTRKDGTVERYMCPTLPGRWKGE